MWALPAQPQGQTEVDLDDQALLEQAQQGRKGERFARLWAGDTSDYSGDASLADMALCGMLAFWTGRDPERIDRLFRQSGLYRDKWERAGYRERTIEQALRTTTSTYTPPQHKRQDRRTYHVYDWQQRPETPRERNRLLAQVADEAKERVRAHFEAQSRTPLVIALPPGVGKSYAVAPLGVDFDIAWVSERHDMCESVPALQAYYRHIERCHSGNCPDAARHEALAAKGRNTWPLHRAHMCAYFAQHKEEGSAVYQVAHVQTAYPKQHEAIVTDELNLSNWLPEHHIGYNTLHAALVAGTTPDERRLLYAVQDVLTQAQQDGEPLCGKLLFDALNTALDRRLNGLVRRMARDTSALTPRPLVPVELSLTAIEKLPPVVVPHLLRALLPELDAWRRGKEWNSCLRLSDGQFGWALYLIEPRRFPLAEEEQLPPWVILDATADKGFLERLLGMPVEMVQRDVVPPPHLRHIAVRTGKRYGKVSLVNAKHSAAERQRAVRELRYLLRELDPDSTERKAGRVGLITFQGAEAELGEALGIPAERRGHFWGMRGSNALADCTLLLVVGTPTPNLTQAESWARALYRHDPQPISTETAEDDDGRTRYVDSRLRGLVDFLTNAELTQCAHRNRPLRHDGRTVVTLCEGEVGHLPVTETLTALPQLNKDGTPYADAKRERDEAKLEAAWERLVARNEPVTVRSLRAEAQVASETAWAYLHARRNATPPVFLSLHKREVYAHPETQGGVWRGRLRHSHRPCAAVQNADVLSLVLQWQAGGRRHEPIARLRQPQFQRQAVRRRPRPCAAPSGSGCVVRRAQPGHGAAHG